MSSVIIQERAEAILAPHIEPISGCLWNAWDQWLGTTLPVGISKRSRANLVYDYAAAEAERMLSGQEGLKLTDERGFLAVNIDEKLLLRFKKFRNGLTTSGIPTRQRALFEYQQLSISGLPITAIVAGYELDDFQREIKRVAITCRVGNRLVWTIPVARPTNAAIVPIETPVEPQPKTEVRSAINKEASATDESAQEEA